MPKKWNADRVVSISAILVSLGTLFIIVFQTQLIMREQKASVKPYLLIGFSTANQESQIFVGNEGLGPAYIESVSILDGDSVHETDPYRYLSPRLSEMDTVFTNHLYVDLLFPGRAIPAAERVTMLRHPLNTQYGNLLIKTFAFPDYGFFPVDPSHPGAVVRIIYKSIYGDRWEIRSDETVPRDL